MKTHTYIYLTALAFLFTLFVYSPSVHAAGPVYSSRIGQERLSYEPDGIAVGIDGKVYITDTWNHRIRVLDNSGNVILTFGSQGSADGQFNRPEDVAVDSLGNIYVIEYANKRVQKFDGAGNFIMKFGSAGAADGQFSNPYGIAVDLAGNIYVADSGNYRIQKFNSSGVFQMKFGSNGTGDGQFAAIKGISVDSSGNIYVSDSGPDTVQKFNSAGVFQLKIGSTGLGDGQFETPWGVVVTSNGTIIISDSGNCRIQSFDSVGVYLAQFSTIGNGATCNYTYGVDIDSAGNIYVTDTYYGRIKKFSSVGVLIATWGALGSENGVFNSPRGLAIDENENVFVADSGNSRIQKFNGAGEYQLQFGSSGAGQGQFGSTINEVEVDDNGYVYIVDSVNARIQKFTNNGEFVISFGSYGFGEGKFVSPSGIAIKSNRVYVSDIGTDSITIWDTLGNYISRITSIVFNDPVALDVDSFGYIYVVDSANQRIVVLNNDGSVAFEFGTYGTANGQFDNPSSIALDVNRNIYVGDYNNNRIQKFDTSGNYILKFGTVGVNDGNFNYPTHGLAVTSYGKIVISDTDNNRVQVYTSGSTTPFLNTSPTITNIKQSEATIEGNVKGSGENTITERGVVYSNTNQLPVLSDSKSTVGGSTGIYTVKIMSLVPSTTYYVRAYATNSQGTSYGETRSFVTAIAIPAITTDTVSSILGSSANVECNVVADYGYAITERGVVYSTINNNPTISDTKQIVPGTVGSFSAGLNGLALKTKYYVRAYAINGIGIGYGDVLTFDTLDAVKPNVSTGVISNVLSNSVSVSGEVTSDGSALIIERGFVYSQINSIPTITDNKFLVTGTTGAMTGDLQSLAADKTYYIRAFATNSEGVGYGDVLTFKTLIPKTLIDVYTTFGKWKYNSKLTNAQLLTGDTMYIKNYDPKKLKIVQIFLYDYSKKGNQSFSFVWKSSSSAMIRTTYNLPTGNRQYAYVVKFQDRATGITKTKYFVFKL